MDEWTYSHKYNEENGEDGNRIRCKGDDNSAVCEWETFNRHGGWDLTMVLASEKKAGGGHDKMVCFADPIGTNLIKHTKIEDQVENVKGKKCLRLT